MGVKMGVAVGVEASGVDSGGGFVESDICKSVGLGSFSMGVVSVPRFRHLEEVGRLNLVDLVCPNTARAEFSRSVKAVGLKSGLTSSLSLGGSSVSLVEASTLLRSVNRNPFSRMSSKILSIPRSSLAGFIIAGASVGSLLSSGFGIGSVISVMGKGKCLKPVMSKSLSISEVSCLLESSRGANITCNVVSCSEVVSGLGLSGKLALSVGNIRTTSKTLMSECFVCPDICRRRAAEVIGSVFEETVGGIVSSGVVGSGSVRGCSSTSVVDVFERYSGGFTGSVVGELSAEQVVGEIGAVHLSGFGFPSGVCGVSPGALEGTSSSVTSSCNLSGSCIFVGVTSCPHFSSVGARIGMSNGLCPLAGVSGVVNTLDGTEFGVPSVDICMSGSSESGFSGFGLSGCLSLPSVSESGFRKVRCSRVGLVWMGV